MASISVVMIVKNEERCLRDCLDSLKHIADEIVVVDTGSTDQTKAIAGEFTDKIFDFVWTGRFCDARNFAFSKASCEYIYSADADEYLDEENRRKLQILKEALVPEVEIVQMYYTNQLKYGTVYNFDKELRPKLFKRLREFTWIEPIHETVRLEPVVFDSEIEIIHRPAASHATRDLEYFERLILQGEALSGRLHGFYAREVFMLGDQEHLQKAIPYFEAYVSEEHNEDSLKEAFCVLAKAGYELEDDGLFYKYAMKAVTLGGCAEICTLLGEYYYKKKDFTESYLWFYNGAYETESILDVRYHETFPVEGIEKCTRRIQ